MRPAPEPDLARRAAMVSASHQNGPGMRATPTFKPLHNVQSTPVHRFHINRNSTGPSACAQPAREQGSERELIQHRRFADKTD